MYFGMYFLSTMLIYVGNGKSKRHSSFFPLDKVNPVHVNFPPTFDSWVKTLGPGLADWPEDGEADVGSVLVRVPQLDIARDVSRHQTGVTLSQQLGQDVPPNNIQAWNEIYLVKTVDNQTRSRQGQAR